MKKLVLIGLLLFTKAAQAQYLYYFLEIKTTGKAQVELAPEMGVTYDDIDTLIVSNRETKKNGAVVVTGKKYESYSAAFNSLSAAGLEFVQFANLSTIGGATAFIAGDIRINYTIWRRRILTSNGL